MGFGFGFRYELREGSGSEFGSGFESGRRTSPECRFGVWWSRVWSGVQVRASVQGSGPEFGLEFRFGLQLMGSGPEFGREFRFGVRFRVRAPFGVRFWVRVGAPSSVLSSGSEFGSGFGGVRNVFYLLRGAISEALTLKHGSTPAKLHLRRVASAHARKQAAGNADLPGLSCATAAWRFEGNSVLRMQVLWQNILPSNRSMSRN